MTLHACANCSRQLSSTTVITSGKLCDKCDWAAGADLFRDDAPTRPREEIPPELTR